MMVANKDSRVLRPRDCRNRKSAAYSSSIRHYDETDETDRSEIYAIPRNSAGTFRSADARTPPPAVGLT